MDLAFETWENDTYLDDRPTNPVLVEKSESFVGALPRVEDDLQERRHQSLVSAWASLRDRAAIESWDGSIKAAAEVLQVRVHEIANAMGLLARVATLSKDASLADQFSNDAPLTAYIAGCYLWLDGVVPTLGTLADQLTEMNPDWASFRQRLVDIEWIFDLAQREEEATPIAWLPDHAAGWVRKLFRAMRDVKAGVDQPFG